MQERPFEINLALELVRVTESAAIGAGRWMGRGDKIAADQAAVDAMRTAMQSIDMDGIVVIGNALSVLALTERGQMTCPREIVYMDKIAVGPEAYGSIDITASPSQNLRWVAKAKRCAVADLTVVILDRPRHEELMEEVRAAGARIKSISDGDVAGGLYTALPETGVDMLLGVGGAPEAVLTAAALKCLGGEIQCRLWPRNDDERQHAIDAGLDLTKVYTTEDMVGRGDALFAATGVTNGELLKGVQYSGSGVSTQSLVMRSYSGTVRWITTHHNGDPQSQSREFTEPQRSGQRA